MRHCHVPGCGGRTTRYGRYCSTHKSRLRRHGAPHQRGVTKAELRPYIGLIRARIERNPDHPLWPHAEGLWGALADHARGICGHFAKGHAGNRYELLAARELLKVAESVPARGVIEAVWAMYLLLEDRPRRFTSDDAFRAQLVRRVRGLSEMNVGEWFDPREGRVKRAYRDLPPHAWKILAKWLASAFGGSGVFLAQLELRQREEKHQKAKMLAEAMKDIR